MYRLIYMSSVRFEIDRDELDQIMAISRRNNAAAGVTGLLIYDGKRFLQYLEGETEAAVSVTFDRITQDPRHCGIVELWVSMGSEREFPDWSMALRRTAKGERLGDAVADMVGQCDPRIASELIGFARLRDEAA